MARLSRRISGWLLMLLLGGSLFSGMATAFVPSASSVTLHYHGNIMSTSSTSVSLSAVSVKSPSATLDDTSYVLSDDEVRPIIKIGEGEKQKIINGFGMWAMVVSFLTGPPWMLAMKLVQRLENDQHRELFDMTGKIWAKTWLTLTNSYPTVSVSVKENKRKEAMCS